MFTPSETKFVRRTLRFVSNLKLVTFKFDKSGELLKTIERNSTLNLSLLLICLEVVNFIFYVRHMQNSKTQTTNISLFTSSLAPCPVWFEFRCHIKIPISSTWSTFSTCAATQHDAFSIQSSCVDFIPRTLIVFSLQSEAFFPWRDQAWTELISLIARNVVYRYTILLNLPLKLSIQIEYYHLFSRSLCLFGLQRASSHSKGCIFYSTIVYGDYTENIHQNLFAKWSCVSIKRSGVNWILYC